MPKGLNLSFIFIVKSFFVLYKLLHNLREQEVPQTCHYYSMKRVIKVGAGATGALVAYGSFSFLYFYRTHSDTRSVSHTFKSALCQWLGQIALDRWGEQQLRNFERDTNNADRIQEDLLLNWIKSNQETEYGRAYQFERIKDKEDFKKLHPLTNYSDYENYIAKIMDGKQNILTKVRFVLYQPL